ncbi:MAG: CDP-alcohol phosphatidyltransferase family protein [Halothiobacillaceae bacterium]|jgi:cardiolipin synthase
MLKHIPNLITAARMLLIPWIAQALFDARYAEAAVLFAVAVVSDGVDGFLARRFGWQTRLGAILDPLADKAMILAAMVALVAGGLLPLWLLVLLLVRDLGIVVGATHYNFFVHQGFVPRPLLIGKLHVFLVAVLILVVIASAWQGWGLDDLRDALIVLVALSTVLSAYGYYRQWSALPRKDSEV